MGGSLKRSVGMAIVISIGNAGGVISSFIYRREDRPRYMLGHGTVIGFIGMTFGLAVVLRLVLAKKNRDRQRLLDERGGADYSMEEMRAHEDDGDDAPFFFYTL